MKQHSRNIKHLLNIGALLLATWSQNVDAFTYTNSNLMLIFRKDPIGTFNDVEFNLGTVSNFLGKANGTVMSVNNWSLPLVQSQFNGSLLNVKFILLAVSETSDSQRRVWLMDGNQGDTPTDITHSKWSQLYSKISSVGAQAAAATATNVSQAYVTNSSDSSSYSQVVTTDGSLPIETISGFSPFPVESDNPATNRFVELRDSTVIPKPPATIVGTFSLTAAGVLTFTAGAPGTALTASHIESIGRTGNLNSVTFTTVSGNNYRLRYTTTISQSAAAWTTLPGSVAGTGSNQTLTDTTSDTQRFYVVESYH